MKGTRRVSTLFLTLVMCMVMCVPALAADSDPKSEVTTKTYDLGNGIFATVTTAPNDVTPMPLAYDRVLDALAAPTARHTFLLERGEGSQCSAQVWNDSKDGTNLQATFAVTINGGTTTLPSEEVSPGRNTNFFIEDRNGNDLVGKTVTTIKAIGADSVRYTYLIDQR